jgi:hypothetical protein
VGGRDGEPRRSEVEGRERDLEKNVSGIIRRILQTMRRRAPEILIVLVVGLMLTVTFAACQEHWLPMMVLRVMRLE